MVESPAAANVLLQNRNRSVARSFYRQLRSEGFAHREIIELSAALIDLVTEDMHAPEAGEAK